jgi:aminoglycoside phosphotransferase (APT) family kinase protein
MMTRDLNLAALAAHLRARFGEHFTVSDSAASAGGMSHLNLVAAGDGGRKVVVRVPPVDGTLAPYVVAREATQMTRAAACGVPVAPVLDVDAAGMIAGRPLMILEFVQGEVLLPRRPWAQPRGTRLAAELVRLLAQLHAVPAALIASDGAPVRAVGAEQQILRWGTSLDSAPDGLPVVPAYVRAWLRERVPPAGRPPTLIHGDYRLGNMIWRGDEVAAVLDWEESGLGDPYYDLAWLLMGTSRDDDLVMGLLPRREIIAMYESLSGPVDLAALRWWEVLTDWVRIAMEIRGIQLNRHQAVADLRSFAWEFGHSSSYRQILRKIRSIDEWS